MPANTVKVDRSTEWGNPYSVHDSLFGGFVVHGPGYDSPEHRTKERAVEDALWLFRRYIGVKRGRTSPRVFFRELKGKNLACWCKPGDPCHADILLRLANR